jgi:LacI family transcriptional regulator
VTAVGEPLKHGHRFRDLMAMGVYRAALEAGLEIPRDLSVVGFDDMELVASGLFPGLTTVALPHHQMGAWASSSCLRRWSHRTERRTR